MKPLFRFALFMAIVNAIVIGPYYLSVWVEKRFPDNRYDPYPTPPSFIEHWLSGLFEIFLGLVVVSVMGCIFYHVVIKPSKKDGNDEI